MYSFEGPFRRPYFNLEDAFVFIPISAFLRQKSSVSSFWECSLCPHYFLLVPEILWQETLVAIGLVSLLPFLLRHPSDFFRFRCFMRKVLPHSLYVLVPAFSIICRDSLPLPILQRRLALYHQSFVVTLLTQIDCGGHLTILDHYRSKLSESEGFVAAAIVTPKHGPLWKVDRAWHETCFFCFIPAQVQ